MMPPTIRSGFRLIIIVSIALGAVLLPTSVLAQRAGERRTEVGADLRWLTGVQFNDVNANETAFGGSNRAVFKSATRFGQAACPEARVAVPLTRLLDAEGSIAYGRSQLTTTITQDPEAADATITESLTAYLLEGGVAAHLARWRKGASEPFVSAGIGYLRQLHDGHTLVEGGRTWYVGAGLRHRFHDDALSGFKSAALRVELRATILGTGSALDGETHVMPAVIAGVLFHP
jgi:hypothetical protein